MRGKCFRTVFSIWREKKSTLYTQTFLEIHTIKFNNGYLCLGSSRKGLLLKTLIFKNSNFYFTNTCTIFPIKIEVCSKALQVLWEQELCFFWSFVYNIKCIIVKTLWHLGCFSSLPLGHPSTGSPQQIFRNISLIVFSRWIFYF